MEIVAHVLVTLVVLALVEYSTLAILYRRRAVLIPSLRSFLEVPSCWTFRNLDVFVKRNLEAFEAHEKANHCDILELSEKLSESVIALGKRVDDVQDGLSLFTSAHRVQNGAMATHLAIHHPVPTKRKKQLSRR